MKESTSGGIGLGTVLLAIFVTLKLTDNIDWSWWWVLSPLWIGLAVVIAAAAVAGIVLAVCFPFQAIARARRAHYSNVGTWAERQNRNRRR